LEGIIAIAFPRLLLFVPPLDTGVVRESLSRESGKADAARTDDDIIARAETLTAGKKTGVCVRSFLTS